MLKTLRKKGVSKKILWGIAAIIIPSFGIFGTSYLFTNQKHIPPAGKMFGRNVSMETFDKAYQNVNVQAIMRYGDNYSKIKSFLNLNAETWDRLILLQEANKRKIQVNDSEVIKTIAAYPFFQRDNQFDDKLYKNILEYVFKIQARDFEESTRDTLKFKQLFEDETKNIKTTDEEILNAYKEINEKVQVSYAYIQNNKFAADAKYTDADVEKYFNDHRLDFLMPPAINVEYLTLEFPPLPAPIPTKDPKSPSPQPKISDIDKEVIHNNALSIYQDLQKNTNLAEVASKYKLKVKTTDYFSIEQPNINLGWPLPLLSKLFESTPDHVLEPQETAAGFVIAKVKNKRDSYIPKFDEIKSKVTNALSESLSKDIAKQKSEEYLKTITEEFTRSSTKDFPAIVKKIGLDIEQTPLFSKGQYLPKVGLSKEFIDAAFNLSEKDPLSKVVETEKGFCILHFDSTSTIDMDQFAKDKTSFSEKILNDRKTQAFTDFLTQLRAKAQVIDNISELQKKQK